MRIHLWSAFASNNSGSYTIVGRFESEERAAQVAAELKEVLEAHGVWADADSDSREPSKRPSPLDLFIEKNRLTRSEDVGSYDDWPQYSEKNVPDAWAIGYQVFVHHRYTLTLPRTLGEFIYAREGRVETELNHAHHRVVGVFEMWNHELANQSRTRDQVIASLLKELHADGGPLVKGVDPDVSPAWKTGGERFAEPMLTLGAVFEDLLTGFTAVGRIAQSHGLYVSVKVFEAWSDADPLAFLRPNHPPL